MVQMLKMTVEERLRRVVAQTLGVAEGDVLANASSQTLAAWTSLAQLTLMAQVEEEFGLTFSMEEMATLSDFRSLCSKVGDYGG